MPIQKLTNRPAEFPEIGQLRKGAAKPERGPGRDLDFFRFTSNDADAVAAFEEAYKDDKDKKPPFEVKARRIRCYLPFDDIDQTFSAFQELYGAGSLKHRCDGEVLWAYSSEGRLEPTGLQCPSLGLPEGHKERCKPVGRLKLFLPELERFAYVTALTTSVIDIAHLSAELAAISAMAGQLTGIPMILSRRPELISMPGRGGEPRRRVEKFMLHIEIDPAFARAKMIAQHQQALMLATGGGLPTPMPMHQLPAPRIVDSQTGEIVERTIEDVDMSDDEADFDEAEADVEIEAESAPPVAQPAPSPISDLTIQERRAYVKRLTALWKEESDLGGKRPEQEYGLDFQAMNKADFMELGGAVKKRLQALRELLATNEPAEE